MFQNKTLTFNMQEFFPMLILDKSQLFQIIVTEEYCLN